MTAWMLMSADALRAAIRAAKSFSRAATWAVVSSFGSSRAADPLRLRASAAPEVWGS